jgi:hypothetical protein
MSLAGAPPLSTQILFIAPPDLVVIPEIDVYVAPGTYIFPTRLGGKRLQSAEPASCLLLEPLIDGAFRIQLNEGFSAQFGQKKEN